MNAKEAYIKNNRASTAIAFRLKLMLDGKTMSDFAKEHGKALRYISRVISPSAKTISNSTVIWGMIEEYIAKDGPLVPQLRKIGIR